MQVVLNAPQSFENLSIQEKENLLQSKYLSNASKGCCDQIQTISTKRIIKKYGVIHNYN